MATSLMLKSVYAEIDDAPKPTIVDLGYITQRGVVDADVDARYQALRAAGIGNRNFSLEGYARLMVEIPPTKTEKIFKAFPIELGETYWRATHHWHGLASTESGYGD